MQTNQSSYKVLFNRDIYNYWGKTKWKRKSCLWGLFFFPIRPPPRLLPVLGLVDMVRNLTVESNDY